MRKTIILLLILAQLVTASPALAWSKWTPYDISKTTLGFYNLESTAEYKLGCYGTITTLFKPKCVKVSLSMYGNSLAPFVETRLPFVPKESKIVTVTNAYDNGVPVTAYCEFYAGSTIVYCYLENRGLWNRYGGWKGLQFTVQYKY
jgi:hypothetical protein